MGRLRRGRLLRGRLLRGSPPCAPRVGVAAGVRPRLCALAAYLIAVCTYRFYFPVMYLDEQVMTRLTSINKDLPYMLDVLALSVGAGQLCAVIGPSGGGKSSLLEAIAGFLPVATGEIRHRHDAGPILDPITGCWK